VAAFVHDTIDHKYPGVEHKKIQLKDNMLEHHCREDVDKTLSWISCMSFSKQDADKCLPIPSSSQLMVDILRDGDRIEALGPVGLQRCRDFIVGQNPDISPDKAEELMYIHCQEKLARLLPEGFITTVTGQELAAPGHQSIIDFMTSYQQKQEQKQA
jgi:hypothetical protein